MSSDILQRIVDAVDRDRLVATACDLVAIPSPTGYELEAAEYLGVALEAAGLDSTIQHVEEGRANAVGRLSGAGGGPSLMLNGHLDTSYSGAEPWLTAPGFQPEPLVVDGAADVAPTGQSSASRRQQGVHRPLSSWRVKPPLGGAVRASVSPARTMDCERASVVGAKCRWGSRLGA